MGKSTIIFSILLLAVIPTLGYVSGRRKLYSDEENDWGQWGEWDHCPTHHFVSGMQLKTHLDQGFWSDDRGLTGIRFFCEPYQTTMTPHKENRTINSSVDNIGSWGQKYICHNGFVTGFQMRNHPSGGMIYDDTAANNLRIFCNWSRTVYLEGDGGSLGSWNSPPKFCEAKEVVCGLMTQVDRNDTWDKTGINNIILRCCALPKSIEDMMHGCKSKTKWEKILTCTVPPPRYFAQPRRGAPPTTLPPPPPCKSTRSIGFGYIDVPDGKKEYFTKHHLGLHSTEIDMRVRFQNLTWRVSEAFQKKKMPRIEYMDIKKIWQYESNIVWQPEISYQKLVNPEEGKEISIWQIHGTCSVMEIWSTWFFREEKNIKTGSVQFTYFQEFPDKVPSREAKS